MTGRVHSYESFGALDGPGLRFVVFLQGCPSRCLYCHNPDTWQATGGQEYTVEQVMRMACKCEPYFGEEGGLTLSGGEPLMQPEFSAAIFQRCRQEGIHTALDTCGYRIDAPAQAVLDHTDLVMLDIKHTDPARHKELTGMDLARPMAFLDCVKKRGIALWVRHVVVPGWTDSQEQIKTLVEMLSDIDTLQRVQLLPYHSMARRKWQEMGMEYHLAETPEADSDAVARLQDEINLSLGLQ